MSLFDKFNTNKKLELTEAEAAFCIFLAVIYADGTMSDDEKSEYLHNKKLKKAEQTEDLYGKINTIMICPHCHATGLIATKSVNHKAGVSGGKATAALLTGGLSLLAVGLSRKEGVTQAHCYNCKNTWLF